MENGPKNEVKLTENPSANRQTRTETCPSMTTTSGRPVGDNQNSNTAGPQGPVLMEDYLLFEKMAQFNRERIPERVVHGKGARLFNQIGKKIEVITRFSTLAGEKGSARASLPSGREFRDAPGQPAQVSRPYL
jgi:catalase